jgi:predicted DNA-binding transcriptional regulator YafY
MEEKIKLGVTSDILKVIDRDAVSFDFLKKDGSLNRNAFLNTLIVNYYKDFQEKEEKLYKAYQGVLKEKTSLEDGEIDDIASSFYGKEEDLNLGLKNEYYDEALSLKPVSSSASTISYIQSYLLHNSSLSSYFRRLLSSYSKLTQDQREKIIFKQHFDLLSKAIKEKRRVFLTTSSEQEPKLKVDPYALCNSLEETHYYLLCVKDRMAACLRVSRLKDVIVLSERCEFKDQKVNAVFDKMEKYGPQYTYQEGEVDSEVELTEKGEKMFSRLYTYRPVPYKREGRHLFFDCSYQQILQYFTRFGEEAFIRKPEILQMQMLDFYNRSSRSYRMNISNKDPGIKL